MLGVGAVRGAGGPSGSSRCEANAVPCKGSPAKGLGCGCMKADIMGSSGQLLNCYKQRVQLSDSLVLSGEEQKLNSLKSRGEEASYELFVCLA